MRAFADGEVITFVDSDGGLLREDEIVVPGSRAIARPQLFGRPGAKSPRPGYHSVTYDETVRGGLPLAEDSEDDEAALTDIAVAAPGGSSNGHASDAGDAAQDAEAQTQRHPATHLTVDEALLRITTFPPEKTTAPEWVEDRVLRAWASLDCVAKQMIRGLNDAVGPHKFEIIRAGVTRKQRSWHSDSLVAGNLAKLCLISPAIWRNIAAPALQHYLADGDGSPLRADLPALAADPLGYYEHSEHPPEAVLLCAIGLRADEGELELIAADTARELGEIKAFDQTTAQEERIRTLEAQMEELRRTAKESDKASREATKRAKKLSDELTELRAAQAQAGDAADAARAQGDEKHLARAEEAEAALETLEADRIPELEAQIEGLEGASERLEHAEAALREERRLRTQAEEDARRHNARVRELTDQVSKIDAVGNLPVEDADALIDALVRPVGQAARHAAERLATGRARPHDDLLLELASSVAQMTRRLDVDAADGNPAAEPTAVEPHTEVEPIEDTAAKAPQSVSEAQQASTADAGEIVKAPVGTVPVLGDAQEPDGVEKSAPPVEESGRQPARRLRRRSKLKVRPLGGAGEIGGSAILVTNQSGHAVMLDCGQRVRGEYGLDSEPQFHRRIGQEGRLHGILLSHAHIDHVGSLPLVYRDQSEAQHEPIPVYMTEPTRDLAKIMLEDSAKIQQHRENNPGDRGFLDYGAGTMEAAYRISDVNRVLDDAVVQEVSPGLAVPIPDTSFVVRFLPVAHVLGSCAIHVTDTDNDQTLLYTGDLGPISDPQATLPQYSLAEMLPADLVVMESTYGAQRSEFTDGRVRRRRSLGPRDAAVKALCRHAEHAHSRGGCLLLPAFSLGRTQELAMLIDQARREGDAPAGEIIVGGMGEKITQVYETFSKGTNAWARAQDMPRVDELGSRMRQGSLTFGDVVGEVLESGFSYIIASPAMLASGWSRTFLENMVDNPDHAIVMSGYVPRHAGNIPQLHRLHTGETMNIGGQNLRIQAEFDQLKGLSAHAPSVDLRKFAEYMARQGNGTAFGMVHGEQAAQEALAEDVDRLPETASAESLHNGPVWQPTRP